jgi:hypothetical protein
MAQRVSLKKMPALVTDTVTMPPSRVPVVRPFDNSLDNDIRKDVVEKDRGHGLPAALVRKVTVEAGSLAKALLIGATKVSLQVQRGTPDRNAKSKKSACHRHNNTVGDAAHLC